MLIYFEGTLLYEIEKVQQNDKFLVIHSSYACLAGNTTFTPETSHLYIYILYLCLIQVKYKKHKRRESADKLLKQRLVHHMTKMGPPPSDCLVSNFQDNIIMHTGCLPQHPSQHSHLSPYVPMPRPYESPKMGSMPSIQSDSVSETDNGLDVDKDSLYNIPMDDSSIAGDSAYDGSSSSIVRPYLGYSTTPSELFCTSPKSPAQVSPTSSHAALISELVRKDCLLSIAEDYKIEQFIGSEQNVAEALCQVGDDIVMKLVHWMRHLPFHREIPVDLQTKILTSKWHELVLLIMTAYSPLSGRHRSPSSSSTASLSPSAMTCKPLSSSFAELYQCNMARLQQYLDKTFGKFFSMEQLNDEIGSIMEQVTHIILQFIHLGITRKEFACLEVILLLTHGKFVLRSKFNHKLAPLFFY